VDIPTKWIIIWLPNHGYQLVLRVGNFKMPAVAMETAKTLNLTQR
jgi:hypothetical protein